MRPRPAADQKGIVALEIKLRSGVRSGEDVERDAGRLPLVCRCGASPRPVGRRVGRTLVQRSVGVGRRRSGARDGHLKMGQDACGPRGFALDESCLGLHGRRGSTQGPIVGSRPVRRARGGRGDAWGNSIVKVAMSIEPTDTMSLSRNRTVCPFSIRQRLTKVPFGVLKSRILKPDSSHTNKQW